MVGASGSSIGERVSVIKVRPRPAPADPDILAAALLWQMRTNGLTPADIHRVITRLPKSRRDTYYRCGELSDALGNPEAEA